MNYIFSTEKTKRYRFPTHINDLVMDRSEASSSEVFIVVLAPGEAPPDSVPPAALASQQQREALLSMGLLAAGLVHEVKNSLTGVIGLLQLARRADADDSAGRAQLPRVERELRDCVDRLNRFLSLRPDSTGGRDVGFCSPQQAVDEAASLVKHAFQMRRIRLQITTQADLPLVPLALGDLRGVLLNLLLNAMQALRAQGNVVLGVRARSGVGVEIDVADDGPGVPPQHRARIFDPMVTFRPRGEGTGLDRRDLRRRAHSW